jgi:hypothetical protein
MIKKFADYIKERLDYGTYTKASSELKKMGHEDRAKELDQHKHTHPAKMSMKENYNDLNSFEIYGEIIEQTNYKGKKYMALMPSKGGKVTVYLASWSWFPSDEANECESALMTPIFLYNTNELLATDVKKHREGLNEILSMQNVINIAIYEEDGVELFGQEIDDFYQFTNRRDAVRFKKIITSDSHFLDELRKSVEGCDNLDAFAMLNTIKTGVSINKLYQ